MRKPNSVPRPPRPRRAALFRHPTSTPHTSKITPPNYTLALSRRLLQPRLPAYGLSPLLGPPACPPAPSFTPGPRLPPHPRPPPPRPWVPSTAPPVRHPLSLRTPLSPVSPISFVPQSLYLSVPVSPHLCVPWTLSGFPPPSPPPHPLPSVFPPQPSFSLIPQSPSFLFPSKSLRLPPAPSLRRPLVFLLPKFPPSLAFPHALPRPRPAPAPRPLGSQPQFPSLPGSFLRRRPFLEGGCAPDGRRRWRRVERIPALPRRPRATAMRRPGRGLGWPPGPQVRPERKHPCGGSAGTAFAPGPASDLSSGA